MVFLIDLKRAHHAPVRLLLDSNTDQNQLYLRNTQHPYASVRICQPLCLSFPVFSFIYSMPSCEYLYHIDPRMRPCRQAWRIKALG